MSFIRKAISYAEDLVHYVLDRYGSERYKPTIPNYKLKRRIGTSGVLVDGGCSMFITDDGLAVLALQPNFEKMNHDEFKQAVIERNQKVFDAVKFLEFCSLVTLEMARDYFDNANLSIPDSTTMVIAKLLITYFNHGTFHSERGWQDLHETADSILKFERVVKNGRYTEFVPKCSPPSIPFQQPEFTRAFVPQYQLPYMPYPQLEYSSLLQPQCLPFYPQLDSQSGLVPQCLPANMPYMQPGSPNEFVPQCPPPSMPCMQPGSPNEFVPQCSPPSMPYMQPGSPNEFVPQCAPPSMPCMQPGLPNEFVPHYLPSVPFGQSPWFYSQPIYA